MNKFKASVVGSGEIFRLAAAEGIKLDFRDLSTLVKHRAFPQPVIRVEGGMRPMLFAREDVEKWIEERRAKETDDLFK
jgi:hypothetical protein